jgi:hypothetical protein
MDSYGPSGEVGAELGDIAGRGVGYLVDTIVCHGTSSLQDLPGGAVLWFGSQGRARFVFVMLHAVDCS